MVVISGGVVVVYGGGSSGVGSHDRGDGAATELSLSTQINRPKSYGLL